MGIWYNDRSEANRRGVKTGTARGGQSTAIGQLGAHFERETLYYLDEGIIDHLADSLVLEAERLQHHYNDFSFMTAPTYKAFEGFLFQIAKDLGLPSSGNPTFAGTYFNEEVVDKQIDQLLQELEQKSESAAQLNADQKQHIKDSVKEMKRFLVHYRHTPAHYLGKRMTTPQQAMQNIYSMYRIINETVRVLQQVKLLPIPERPQ